MVKPGTTSPPQRPLRILLSKVGLDGHDRGVKVLAREFRDAGFDVIYTGLWQTPQSTVQAAMQEDVDLIGVSLHSAAHLTIMPVVLDECRRRGVDYIPVVLGGIIPEADYQPLREMGIAAVFNPGSPMSDIIATCRRLGQERAHTPFDRAVKQYTDGNVTGLAQLLTWIQRDGVPGGWKPPTGRATLVGVTGAPGVGKSSFIGKLARVLRARGPRVAVIAVDPTSHRSGGALLGDRLRMMWPEPDDGFFVRSLASGGMFGGLGPGCRQIVDALSGFGFDYILLETVGAGQSDIDVHNLTEHVLVLVMPHAGDDIQFAKSGIMEIASGLVLNKADLPGADTTRADLLSAVGHARPVWPVSSLRNEGLEPIADWIMALGR